MKQFLLALGKAFNISRIILLNVLFFGVLILIIVASSQQDELETIDDEGVVRLSLNGLIVEQEIVSDEILAQLQNDGPQQILLFDVIDTIDRAASDDRVKGLILLPSGMGASFTSLDEIGQALSRFKETGKPIISTSQSYSQSAYYLASFADEIYIGDMGGVDLMGLASYRPYFGEFLERYGIDVHVFKVGTYKSAVEPFMGGAMSAPARENAEQWMGDLWGNFTTVVETNRHLETGFVNTWLDHYPETLSAHDGHFATMALELGLVDGIKTRTERLARLAEFADEEGDDPGISWRNYRTQLQMENLFEASDSEQKIAVIVASGEIVDGSQPPGMIGGDSTAELIRRAREDNEVDALVLRVNSPGGSANASEVIREQIVATREAGIPVVISMGGLAASGGYWISTSADYIFANPQTITGSIGVFGIVPTFDRLAGEYSIYSDGVATTPMAGGFDPLNGISEPMARTIQLSIENIYSQFLAIVAEGRNSTPEKINEIAQGRVWSGERALELGLVDEFGTLDDAVNHAAALAELEDYQTINITQPLTPTQQFFRDMKQNSSIEAPAMTTTERLLNAFQQQLIQLNQLNDPRHVYLSCGGCPEQP
ncbi:MAG: signal peptide peptidase SppA [Pseudomonadales bacterium]|jgi:protease-4